MKRETAHSEQFVDTDRVRATRFDFPPGSETGWHVHQMDYVITTLTPCTMLLEEPGGHSREVSLEAGAVYTRDAGVEHNVINNGDAMMRFVEVELK